MAPRRRRIGWSRRLPRDPWDERIEPAPWGGIYPPLHWGGGAFYGLEGGGPAPFEPIGVDYGYDYNFRRRERPEGGPERRRPRVERWQGREKRREYYESRSRGRRRGEPGYRG